MSGLDLGDDARAFLEALYAFELVVSSPVTASPPLFGVSPFWSFIDRDKTVRIDIGPAKARLARDREFLAGIDGLVRSLRTRMDRGDLVRDVLAAVPQYESQVVVSSDSPGVWVWGWHPTLPWVYHYRSVYEALEDAAEKRTESRRRKLRG